MDRAHVRSFINKRDIIILAMVLLVSAWGIFASNTKSGGDEDPGVGNVAEAPRSRNFAVFYFDGVPVRMAYLDEDEELSLPFNPNVRFEIKEGAVSFVESDCPDQLCVHMGRQDREGGFAACLPNRIFFFVERDDRFYTLHRKAYLDLFDTVIYIMIYAESEEQYQFYEKIIYDELQRLHRLFDIYGGYEDLDNLRTVNDKAGITPVTVDESIIDLAMFGLEAYERSGGVINIGMGSVLSLWRSSREAAVPPGERELASAALHTDIANMELDREAGTIYLRDPGMSLDVGAIAKGYAVEQAMLKAREAGMISGIISAGGNVSVAGHPMDGREAWRVGIENPDGGELLDAVDITGGAVVTSGNYQRYFEHEGVRYHHIIDPFTLMPANTFKSVTIIHPDSGIADFLSTALYIMPREEGTALLEVFGGEALWILQDGTPLMTDGYREISNAFKDGGDTDDGGEGRD